MLSDEETDLVVAKRIRLRRKSLGMTQLQLSTALGVTYQQVQKFERGTNRVSAGRLWRIAQILDVPVSHFFNGVAEADLQSGDRIFDALTRDTVCECVTGLASVTDRDIKEFVIPLVTRLRG